MASRMTSDFVLPAPFGEAPHFGAIFGGDRGAVAVERCQPTVDESSSLTLEPGGR